MTYRVYRPGVVIGERYRIIKALARGGCSTVYRGVHIEMERPVALKLLDPQSEGAQAHDDVWVRRFTREAQLASQLNHPNTITIFDYGRDRRHDDLLFIAMEYVDGQSLRDVILEEGSLEPERTARILAQILASLDEAHQRGILHRDLKPSNVMVYQDHLSGAERVKVLDFGLAKLMREFEAQDSHRVTRDGDFIGTPRYASPEQLRGKELSERSDIYGVGMIAWEMLVGAPAVAALDYAACVKHHLGPAPWLLPQALACPSTLSDIVHRALAKPPQERYQDARTMYRDLDAWLQVEGDEAGIWGGPSSSAELGADDSHEELFAAVVSEVEESEPTAAHTPPPVEMYGTLELPGGRAPRPQGATPDEAASGGGHPLQRDDQGEDALQHRADRAVTFTMIAALVVVIAAAIFGFLF